MDRLLTIFITAVFLLTGFGANAQRNEFNSLTVGLKVRPIIPSGLLRTATAEVTGNAADENEFLRLSVDQKLGYSFGLLVRKNFTRRFAMETGVTYVRRGFDVAVTDLDSNRTDEVDFGLTSYEIPVMALVYIRLGEQFYMNTSLGLSLDIGARSVANKPESNIYDHFTAIRQFNGGVLANVGIEWRTEESGSFYLGATYHQPTGPIADTKVNYFRTSSASDASIETPLSGTYLTLDIRYYFHEPINGDR